MDFNISPEQKNVGIFLLTNRREEFPAWFAQLPIVQRKYLRADLGQSLAAYAALRPGDAAALWEKQANKNWNAVHRGYLLVGWFVLAVSILIVLGLIGGVLYLFNNI